jgi:hypothetical protein
MEGALMLPPTIVCAVCHRASEGHAPIVVDRNGVVVYGGECVSLRRRDKRHGQLESLR